MKLRRQSGFGVPLAAFLAINLLVPALPGQDAETGKWMTAVKAADGRQVRIEHVDGKKQSGTLVRGSETGFVLVLGKADVAIDRGTVSKIQIRRGRSRGKRALIGLGIGAAAMIAPAVIFARAFPGDSAVIPAVMLREPGSEPQSGPSYPTGTRLSTPRLAGRSRNIGPVCVHSR